MLNKVIGTLQRNAASSARASKARGTGGQCARFVRLALQAGGIVNSGIGDAWEYAHRLPALGFVEIDVNSQPRKGDIMVYDRAINQTPKRLYGHVQMYDGKKWICDFIQKGVYPWATKGNEVKRLFRRTQW